MLGWLKWQSIMNTFIGYTIHMVVIFGLLIVQNRNNTPIMVAAYKAIKKHQSLIHKKLVTGGMEGKMKNKWCSEPTSNQILVAMQL